MGMVCRHFIIKGQVQGVWFRKHTKQQADRLGITVYVKNSDNGDVEVMACGTQGMMVQLTEWLWQGSPRSKVDDVLQGIVQEVQSYDSFDIQ